MRKAVVKILSVLLALAVLAASASIGAGAISYKNKVNVKSESVLMVNMDSNQVVYEKDPDSKRYPASTTKIMTYIIAVENIDDLENTRIEVKQKLIDQLRNTGSSLSNMGDHVGKKVRVIDLLYSMMVPSGNDAALILADYVGGGDIEKFVDMMNKKAEELGCENTHFQNPDGLHHKDHYTTARDLYKITTYALTLPRFMEICNTTEYTCEGDEYPITTTNYLIDEYRGGQYYYMYAKGIKTGTTDEAGRCLVTTASADGYSYILILLGAPYKEGVQEEYFTFYDAADLFRWALVDLELKTIKTTSTPVCEAKVKYVWGQDKVTLLPERSLNAIVPKDIKPENIVVDTDIPEEIEAPLYTDKSVGTATVYYVDSSGGEKQKIATVNLVPEQQLERSAILVVLDVFGTIWRSAWFLIVIGVIVLIVVIYIIAAKIHRAKVRKKRQVKRYRNF